MAFSPASVSVAAGDTITFVNLDRAPHTATAVDGSFDTGRLRRGEAVKVTFPNTGTVGYACAIHPSMRGEVSVR